MAITADDAQRFFNERVRSGDTQEQALQKTREYLIANGMVQQTPSGRNVAASFVKDRIRDEVLNSILSSGANATNSSAPVILDSTGEAIASATPWAIDSGNAVLVDSAGKAIATAGPETVAATAGYSPLPGVAGAVLGYDVLKNKQHGGKGARKGAAAGAGIGFSVGGIGGAAIGAPIGAAIGYFGNFGDRNRYEEEWQRANKLRERGVNWQWNQERPTSGRSKDELIKEAEATGDQATIDFAKTRDEGFLTPQQTMGYSLWGENYGNDYANAPIEVQLAVNKLALDRKALREHHGQVDKNKNFDENLDKQIREVLSSGKVPEGMNIEVPKAKEGEASQDGGEAPTSLILMPGQPAESAEQIKKRAFRQAVLSQFTSNEESVNLVNTLKSMGQMNQDEANRVAYLKGTSS